MCVKHWFALEEGITNELFSVTMAIATDATVDQTYSWSQFPI